MFTFLKTEKLPRGLKKLLTPSGKFVTDTKTTFLAVFDAAHPGARATHRFTMFGKTIVACGALVAIFAGASVYADTANVPADSAFYPLKRLSENVQLAITPSQDKPELEATFAARRVAELADIQKRKPSSTIVVALSDEINSDIGASLTAAQTANLQDGKLDTFCAKVLSVAASSSVELGNKPSVSMGTFIRFENRCEGDLDQSTSSASGTSFRGSGRGYRIDIPFGNVTTTQNENTSSTHNQPPFKRLYDRFGTHASVSSTINIAASTTVTINSGTEVSSTVESSNQPGSILKSLLGR